MRFKSSFLNQDIRGGQEKFITPYLSLSPLTCPWFLSFLFFLLPLIMNRGFEKGGLKNDWKTRSKTMVGEKNMHSRREEKKERYTVD